MGPAVAVEVGRKVLRPGHAASRVEDPELGFSSGP